MADNTDILALLGEILRATDRQTAANTRAIEELRTEMREANVEMRQANAEMREANAEMRQANVEMRQEFTAIFNRFGEAVADGFIRSERKLEEVKQEVSGVKQEVAELRQEAQRAESNQPTLQDIVRRLTVVETIVLPKAS